MKAQAPGKLILSGEHAVVHGRPALVMAVNRHAHVEIEPIAEDQLAISFPGLLGEDHIPTAALPGLKKRLMNNYQQFLAGDLGIRHVLGSPAELLYYGVIYLLEETNAVLKNGLRIAVDTDLPLGSGMGSSAAVVAAVLGGVAAQLELEPDRAMVYRWTLDVERMQHGHPSGVDPFISVHGGMVRFQHGEAVEQTPLKKPLQVVLAGTPESTTGECVAEVSHNFPATDPIWNQFEQVTGEMENAIKDGEWDAVAAAIRANHRLLCRIGVVPKRVQRFIEAVEERGGAAKACGAGAVAGEGGGAVLIFGESAHDALCAEYDYEHFPIEVDVNGLSLRV